MPGLVKLRLGNMFDGPADLIVLPCSTQGTVTRFVADTLRNYRLPRPKSDFKIGEIDILPFEGGESIAQFVAFAASVDNMRSSLEAIQAIGEQLGNYTHQEKLVRAISAPLLGAGSGRLGSENVVNALRDGFKRKAHPEAILTISVLHQDVFDRLSANKSPELSEQVSQESKNPRKPIRLFMSYTGTSPEHKSWVVELATFLRQNGIETRLDQWHLRSGMDLPHWMGNELEIADRVLIISDSQYAAKADGRLGGVGWETMLIQGDMANSDASSDKYLVIVRDNDLNESIPKYLRTKLCIHWPMHGNDAQNQQKLLTEIYRVSSEPPIGEPPVWL